MTAVFVAESTLPYALVAAAIAAVRSAAAFALAALVSAWIFAKRVARAATRSPPVPLTAESASSVALWPALIFAMVAK